MALFDFYPNILLQMIIKFVFVLSRRVTTSPPRTRRSSTSSQGSSSEVAPRLAASVPASPARVRPRSRSPRPASTNRPRSRSPRPPQQTNNTNNSDSGSEVSDEGYRSLGNKLTVPNHDADDLPTGKTQLFSTTSPDRAGSISSRHLQIKLFGPILKREVIFLHRSGFFTV